MTHSFFVFFVSFRVPSWLHSLFDEPDTGTTKGVIDETQKAFYEKQLEEKDKLIAHCKEVICEMRKVIECLRKKK